jgi:hypothetical protein
VKPEDIQEGYKFSVPSSERQLYGVVKLIKAGWAVCDIYEVQPSSVREENWQLIEVVQCETYTGDIPVTPQRNLLNGMTVLGQTTGSIEHRTMYLRIPKELQVSCGPCSCSTCQGQEGFWDTLAINTNATATDMAWTCHMPDKSVVALLKEGLLQ